MNISSVPLSPLTWADYFECVEHTNNLPPGDQLLRFGFYGQVGSLLSTVKKVQRDTLGETSSTLACEELGDALWYLVALAMDSNLSGIDVGASCIEHLRRAYNENEVVPAAGSSFRNADGLVAAQAKPDEVEQVDLLKKLAYEAGVLVDVNHVQADFRDRSLRDQIGAIAATLTQVCSAFGISLDYVARENVAKVLGRWPVAGTKYTDFFDAADLPHERFPRRLEIFFEEREDGGSKVVVQRIGDVFIGDRLTDNSFEDDGYRFHDVFHLSYIAHLGWSPVVRGLLKRKRKSKREVDENEDGARAAIIEEGIATWIFNHAQRENLFAGVVPGRLSYGLLKQIQHIVRGFEVEICPLWQWERAILDGFSVFRLLREEKKGLVVVDMNAHTIELMSGEHQ